MPHDKNGTLLSVGDEVVVHAIVTRLSAGEDYCNVNAETLEPMYPGTGKSSFSLNAKQFVKVATPDQVGST